MDLTRRSFLAATAASAAFPAPALIASPNSWSDLDLILGADISTSISSERYKRQHDGYADALRNEENMELILERDVHSCFFHYAGVAVPKIEWRHLNSEGAILSYADEIQGLPRVRKNFTKASRAISFALEKKRSRFEETGVTALRTKLDIACDGDSAVFKVRGTQETLISECEHMRDLAENEGMQINALIMMRETKGKITPDDISVYNRTLNFYETSVITRQTIELPRPGFIKEAPRAEDFTEGMTRKIRQELML